MLRLRRVFKLCIGIVIVGLAGCNLSLGVPIPTVTPPRIQTLTPFPTLFPTQTVLPTVVTVTPRPQPTSNIPPPYSVRQPVPGPACSVAPNVAAANIRSGPNTSFPVIGVLPANNWVSAARLDSNGWYQIAYAGTVVNGGWISNTVVNLQQPCSCGPNNCTVVSTLPPPTNPPPPTVTTQPPPNQCTILPLTPSDVVNIYYQPSNEAQIWDTLKAGGMVVSGRTNDGWYAIGPLNLQGSMIGINALRWIRTDARITLTGAPCGTLPTVDLSYPPAGNCTVSPMNISSIPIYPQHSFDFSPVGTVTSGSSLPVVGKTPANTNGAPNGWYAVDTGVVQAGTVGRYRLRWIPIDNNAATTGSDCAALPTVTLNP
jgi:uncharacterized protein YgiM (DUF1202 family)